MKNSNCLNRRSIQTVIYSILLSCFLSLFTTKITAQFFQAAGLNSTDLHSFDYSNSNTIWLIGNTKTYISNNSGALFNEYISSDTTNYPNNLSLNFNYSDVLCVNSNSAFLYGDYDSNNSLTGIRKSNLPNGNWGLVYNTNSNPEYGEQIMDMALGENNFAIAVGSNGLIIRSTDGGNAWSLVSSEPELNDYTQIEYLGNETWVIATVNKVLKSINNGLSWTPYSTNLQPFDNFYPLDMSFFGMTGYIGMYGYGFLKTTDGGESWEQMTTPFPCYKIQTINGQLVYAAQNIFSGEFAKIYKSINGGLTWEAMSLDVYENILDFKFYSGNLGGVITTDNAYFTTNGGGNTTPVAYFSSPDTQCQGDIFQLTNLTSNDPSYTYEWKFDGNLVSQEYELQYQLDATGNHNVELIVTNEFGSHSHIKYFYVSPGPIQPILNVTISNNTYCSTADFSVTVESSQVGVNYKLFINNAFYASQTGNGNDISFITQYFSSSAFGHVLAISTTQCNADTTIYNFNLPIYNLDPNLEVFLPNDTLCLSSQPYIGIANSNPEWSYKYGTTGTYYAGDGDTLLIPFTTTNTSVFTPSIIAKHNASGCITTKSANSTLIRIQPSSSFSISPLAVHVDENVSLNLTSDYTYHYWEFNESANPSQYYGIPPALSYGTVGRDTIELLEVFTDSSCQASRSTLINIVEDITATPVEFCLSNTIQRTQQTLQAITDNNGNHILCGYYLQSSGFKALFVRKENSLGELIFENTLPISGISTTGFSVATDDAQNIYLVGTAASGYAVWGSYLTSSTFLVKFNTQGEFEWILHSGNTIYLGVEVEDNEIYALCKGSYIGSSFNLDQSANIPYPVQLSNGSSTGVAVQLFVKYSTSGLINDVLIIGNGENATNPNAPLISNLIFTSSKFKIVEGHLYLLAATSSYLLSHNYYAGSSIIDSDFQTSYGLENDSRLLFYKIDLQTLEMSGKFILVSEGNSISDFEVLENRIIVLCKMSNGAYFDNTGYNTNEFITTSYAKNIILGLNLNGSLDWKKFENTSHFSSIIKKNSDSAYLITNTQGLGSFLGLNTNHGYTSNGIAGSLMLTMSSDGEVSDFYSIDDETLDMVQSISLDACGNPIISKASSMNAYGTPLNSYSSNTTWTTAKINLNSCNSGCSFNEINQLFDIGIFDIDLVQSETDPNLADVILQIQNNGAIEINSFSIDVIVNGQSLFAEFSALNSTFQNVSTHNLGTINLNGLSYHHIFAQVATVNEQSGDNYAFNNTMERSQWLCPGPLSGNHYIGNNNTEFRTFQESAIALQTCGVDGPVNFLIEPGDYFGQLKVYQFEGNIEANPITWQSTSGNSTDVNFIYAQSDLQYYNHITMDPDVAFLNFKSISIKESISSIGDYCILFNQNSHDVTIENCIFYDGFYDKTFIYSTSSTKCSNINILNNTFSKGKRAIDLQGNSVLKDENINIIGNTFIDQHNVVCTMYYSNNIVFSSNYSSLNLNVLNATSCFGKMQIEKNEIIAEGQNLITIANYTGNADNLNESIVANNIITSSNNYATSALALSNVTNLGVWHNTFHKSIYLTSVNNISILNNIIGNISTMVDLNGTNTNLTIDYNQYYPFTNAALLFGTSTQSNLTFDTWQQTTGYDAHSIVQTPYFASPTDGHVLAYLNTGIPITQVPLDFDDDLRSTETPIIGADEPGYIPFQIYLLNQDEPSCNQYSDGFIEVTAIESEGEVNYTWEDGAIGNVRSNLSSGIYTVVAIDELGQTDTLSISIIDPPIFDIQIDLDSICFNGYNASASLTYFNPVGTLTYEWSTGITGSSLSSVGAGEIWVEVITGTGCVARDTTYLYGLPYVVLSNEIVQTSCPTESGGSIDITLQGGDGNYTYEWSNGQTSQDIFGLDPGTYSVEVTDGDGCILNFSRTLYQPLEIEISTTTDCFVSDIGSATYTRTGGGAGFDYLWSTGATSNTISNLSGGWYSIEVIDGTGCIAKDSILLREIQWSIALDSIHMACVPNDLAEIFTTTDNENAISSVIWSNGNSEFDLLGIVPGEYEMIVTDTLGCSQQITAVIDEIPVLEILPESVCFDGNNGQLHLVTSITEPTNIIWNTGQNTNTISDLANGVYSVIAQYSNGCEIEQSYNLNLSILEVEVENIISPICWYDNGEIDLYIQGGNYPYFFIWSNYDFSQNLVDAPIGNYWVDVYDNIGCMVEVEVELTSQSQPFSFDLIGSDVAYLDSTGIFTLDIPEGSSIAWQVTDALLLDSNEDSLWVEFNELGFVEIFATMTNEFGCIANDQIDVFVEQFISVYENNDFEISAYPNPVSDRLSIISNHGKPIELRMLDSNGRLVQIKTFVTSTSLDVNNLASGNYTLVFSENGKVIDQKKVVIVN